MCVLSGKLLHKCSFLFHFDSRVNTEKENGTFSVHIANKLYAMHFFTRCISEGVIHAKHTWIAYIHGIKTAHSTT